MRDFVFGEEVLAQIRHDRYHHPRPRVQRKMEVLWLKSHGLGHDQIAAYADVSRRTVQRYLDQYLEGGLPRLRRCPWHQPQSVLAEHQDSLEEYFRKHPVRSAKQAQASIIGTPKSSILTPSGAMVKSLSHKNLEPVKLAASAVWGTYPPERNACPA